MEARYLEPPEDNVDEAGWYVCTPGGEILAGPFVSENAAQNEIERRTPRGPK